MIPWPYNNKWYIIDLCKNKISINNLLIDECYTKFTIRGMGNCFSGYLYKNYLYACEVNDIDIYKIRIWDLVDKNLIKTINFYSKISNILTWNNNYGLIASKNNLNVINLESQYIEETLNIKTKNDYYINNIKKIKLNELGECLICLDDGNNINLYNEINENNIIYIHN